MTGYREVRDLLTEVLRRMSGGVPHPIPWEHAEDILRAVVRATAEFQGRQYKEFPQRRIEVRIMRLKKRADRELWECCGTPRSDELMKLVAATIRAKLES